MSNSERATEPPAALDFRYSPIRHLTGRLPPGMPPAFWKRLRASRTLLLAPIVAMGLAGGCCLFVLLEILSRSPRFSLPLLGFIASVSGLVELVSLAFMCAVPRLCKSTFEHDIRESDFTVCLCCGYSLRGLPTEHSCPECGVRFNKEELRQQWESWFNRRHV